MLFSRSNNDRKCLNPRVLIRSRMLSLDSVAFVSRSIVFVEAGRSTLWPPPIHCQLAGSHLGGDLGKFIRKSLVVPTGWMVVIYFHYWKGPQKVFQTTAPWIQILLNEKTFEVMWNRLPSPAFNWMQPHQNSMVFFTVSLVMPTCWPSRDWWIYEARRDGKGYFGITIDFEPVAHGLLWNWKKGVPWW